MARGAVIIICEGQVALIRREVSGRVYFLFPGGTVETGETEAQAAVREAWEELGVVVTLGQKLAVVRFSGTEQHYFQAEIVGGTFGTGCDPEMAQSAKSEGGSFTPTWVALTDLPSLDVRPKTPATALGQRQSTEWKRLDFAEG